MSARRPHRRRYAKPAWSKRAAWERDAAEPEPVDHEAARRESTPGPGPWGGGNASGCSRTRPLYETEET